MAKKTTKTASKAPIMAKKDIPSPFDMKTGVDVGKGPKMMPKGKALVPTKKGAGKKGKGC